MSKKTWQPPGARLVRARTNDLAGGPPNDGRTTVYTQEEIGPNRALLPNGNLICYSVPLARTGWLIYGPQEVPVAPGERGVSYVERTADTLFAPDTIASFNGAALTIGHPEVDVDPTNWERLAGGYAINVRRGTGDDADVLLGDIIVTKKRFIDEILSGLKEVSPGYDADYRDRGKGIGSQYNILGNHVALVPRGRCGPRCAIGDEAFMAGEAEPLDDDSETNHQESYSMPTASNAAPLARRPLNLSKVEIARQRFNDAQAELEALEEGAADDGAVHVHLHGIGEAETPRRAATADAATEERFTAIEGTLGSIQETLALLVPARTADKKDGEEDGDEDDDGRDDEDDAPPEKKKAKKKTGDEAHADSAALATSYTTLVSQAEILVPGFKVPTFDAALSRAKTVDRMCNLRRKALDGFATTDAGAAILAALSGGQAPDLLTMECGGVASLFKTAATAKAAATHQATATRDAAHQQAATLRSASAGVPSIASLNAQNAKFWEGK